VRLFLARVHISIETREIATRYLEAKFMATIIPVKSVSTAELLTYRSSDIGPVISVCFEKAGVV
jgi:hypothetical protein